MQVTAWQQALPGVVTNGEPLNPEAMVAIGMLCGRLGGLDTTGPADGVSRSAVCCVWPCRGAEAGSRKSGTVLPNVVPMEASEAADCIPPAYKANWSILGGPICFFTAEQSVTAPSRGGRMPPQFCYVNSGMADSWCIVSHLRWPPVGKRSKGLMAVLGTSSSCMHDFVACISCCQWERQLFRELRKATITLGLWTYPMIAI